MHRLLQLMWLKQYGLSKVSNENIYKLYKTILNFYTYKTKSKLCYRYAASYTHIPV